MRSSCPKKHQLTLVSLDRTGALRIDSFSVLVRRTQMQSTVINETIDLKRNTCILCFSLRDCDGFCFLLSVSPSVHTEKQCQNFLLDLQSFCSSQTEMLSPQNADTECRIFAIQRVWDSYAAFQPHEVSKQITHLEDRVCSVGTHTVLQKIKGTSPCCYLFLLAEIPAAEIALMISFNLWMLE